MAVQLPLQTAVLVPLLGAIALGYAHLKRVPLVKPVLLPVIWTWSVIALPYGDGSWFGWHALRLPIALPLVLLIAAGCLLCDLKDEQSDREEGVASLPAQLGATRSAQLATALALLAALVATVEHRTGLVVSAFALGLTTLWPRLLATESVGPLIVDVALTLPGILIATRLI
jgi:4-hydroxybenzoate polyprenyltransferase